MPGADDPCTFLLPQQAFHPCMLPQATRLETLNLCTNPHACDIDGVAFIGSSGQPLDDIMRYVPGDDRLGALVESLKYRHLAPTAPDTLGCCPFTTTDPFVLKECPHLQPQPYPYPYPLPHPEPYPHPHPHPTPEPNPNPDQECPHVYFAANQPAFAETLVEGDDGQRVRVITLPGERRSMCVASGESVERYHATHLRPPWASQHGPCQARAILALHHTRT